MPLRGLLCYQTPGAGIVFRIRAPSWNRLVAACGLSRIPRPRNFILVAEAEAGERRPRALHAVRHGCQM